MPKLILRVIVCVLFSFFFASKSAFAIASTKRIPIRNLAPDTRTTLPLQETSYPATRVRLAPLFALQDQSFGYGGLIELSFNTNSPFYIGIESGYIQWQTDPEVIDSVVAISIPILASFIYRFDLSRSNLHPYLGGAIGVVLNRGDVNSANSEVTSYETSFHATARPGVEFELSKTTAFFVEPQFGLLKSQFVFLPQAGLAFSF